MLIKTKPDRISQPCWLWWRPASSALQNERSFCQDYQTGFIHPSIACCLGNHCNSCISLPLSDWRLYWLVPLSWPSDPHSSCQEMKINKRESALKPIDFSWLLNIWKFRPAQPLLWEANMNNLTLRMSVISYAPGTAMSLLLGFFFFL